MSSSLRRLIPLALAALLGLASAWVLLGLGGAGEVGNEPRAAKPAAAAVAQGTTEDSIASEVENRDVDSYAAYQSKDPFRQLLAPAEAAAEEAAEDASTAEPLEETPEDTNGSSRDQDQADGIGAGRGNRDDGPNGGNAGGGATGPGGLDSDDDGITNRRENALGLDPTNPDSDGDNIPDGQDDSNGNNIPDGREGGRGGREGRENGGGGGTNGSNNLFDSGGVAY